MMLAVSGEEYYQKLFHMHEFLFVLKNVPFSKGMQAAGNRHGRFVLFLSIMKTCHEQEI